MGEGEAAAGRRRVVADYAPLFGTSNKQGGRGFHQERPPKQGVIVGGAAVDYRDQGLRESRSDGQEAQKRFFR